MNRLRTRGSARAHRAIGEIEFDTPRGGGGDMRTRDLKPNPTVYLAVQFLRRRGHTVYRVDDDRHEYDGMIVPTSWLLDMAKAEQWVLPGNALGEGGRDAA